MKNLRRIFSSFIVVFLLISLLNITARNYSSVNNEDDVIIHGNIVNQI